MGPIYPCTILVPAEIKSWIKKRKQLKLVPLNHFGFTRVEQSRFALGMTGYKAIGYPVFGGNLISGIMPDIWPNIGYLYGYRISIRIPDICGIMRRIFDRIPDI